MPIIEPENLALKNLAGIHLWHAPLSSCSQRVRLVLAEKGLGYTSHPIRLELGENASEEYQAIHPAGLVPAVVIDGELIVESVDIIAEIDRRYSAGSLRPANGGGDAEIAMLLEKADQSQPWLKLLTFEFLFSAVPPPQNTIARIAKDHRNAALRQFYQDFQKGFPRDKVSAAVNACHADLTDLNRSLSDGFDYLAGTDFSLADIAWLPNVHRYQLIGWPLAHYPELHRWYDRVRQRQSYRLAIADYEPRKMLEMAKPVIAHRMASGDGVESYIEFEEDL